jgi:hypothetical protein
MFKDMLGGTTYTRYSFENTTYLTQPLESTDTEIYLADASVLTPPMVEENVPGVVLINGERIEFYQIDDNTLKQITRGTLGTGVSGRLERGTEVFDQGTSQEFETSDTTNIQYIYTNNALPYYEINRNDSDVTIPNTTATMASKGITIDTNLPLQDQIEVYLGGRLLRKSRKYQHDTSVLLDNISLDSIKGTFSSFEYLNTVSASKGDSYIDSLTGKVWTYTRTRTENTTAPGWVYSGMTRFEPEYTVTVDGLSQRIQLNIEVTDDIEIAVVKKLSGSGDFNSIITTSTTETLWNSTSSIAMFLKESPTRLPRRLSSSADDILRNEQGQPLTNESNDFLTGNI